MNKINHLQDALKLFYSGYQAIPLCKANLQGGGCLHHGSKCSNPGKVPLTRRKRQTKVTEQEAGPDANIEALISGHHIVVDVDPRNGGEGFVGASVLRSRSVERRELKVTVLNQ